MPEENIYDEFEVTFDFQNVLYICQVQVEGMPDDSFYEVEYFSPNEKGTIEKLVAQVPVDGTEHIKWIAQGAKENPLFIQALGEAIEKKEPNLSK